jgi:hypothetical protein
VALAFCSHPHPGCSTVDAQPAVLSLVGRHGPRVQASRRHGPVPPQWAAEWLRRGPRQPTTQEPTTKNQERGKTMTALNVPTQSPAREAASDSHGASRPVSGRATTENAAPNDVTGVHPVGTVAIIGLRLSLGFLFLWAFLDKAFGLGYSTSSKDAWIRGGSPTKGFLSGADVGPPARSLPGARQARTRQGLAVHARAARYRGRPHPGRGPPPSRRLRDASCDDDVVRGLAFCQDSRWATDQLHQPHRRGWERRAFAITGAASSPSRPSTTLSSVRDDRERRGPGHR